MTEFESTIERVRPILEAAGFKTIESFRNYVKLGLGEITITFGYDEREEENIFYISSSKSIFEFGDLLNPENLKQVFKYERQFNKYSDFLVDFLNNEGKGILSGEVNLLTQLSTLEAKRAEVYTANLMESQRKSTADNAWAKGDYSTFVRTIEQMRKNVLPDSYKLKYRIASRELEKGR